MHDGGMGRPIPVPVSTSGPDILTSSRQGVRKLAAAHLAHEADRKTGTAVRPGSGRLGGEISPSFSSIYFDFGTSFDRSSTFNTLAASSRKRRRSPSWSRLLSIHAM